jgi:hypothetical protein
MDRDTGYRDEDQYRCTKCGELHDEVNGGEIPDLSEESVQALEALVGAA